MSELRWEGGTKHTVCQIFYPENLFPNPNPNQQNRGTGDVMEGKFSEVTLRVQDSTLLY